MKAALVQTIQAAACIDVPGSSGAARGERDAGRGAPKNREDVDAAEKAMKSQVTPAKTRGELQRAGQEREESTECVRDEKMTVRDHLQAIRVVHGVIGNQKYF